MESLSVHGRHNLQGVRTRRTSLKKLENLGFLERKQWLTSLSSLSSKKYKMMLIVSSRFQVFVNFVGHCERFRFGLGDSSLEWLTHPSSSSSMWGLYRTPLHTFRYMVYHYARLPETNSKRTTKAKVCITWTTHYNHTSKAKSIGPDRTASIASNCFPRNSEWPKCHLKIFTKASFPHFFFSIALTLSTGNADFFIPTA